MNAPYPTDSEKYRAAMIANSKKMSRAGKHALDLAHRLGGTIYAGSHVLAGKVHRVNAGTLRVLCKLRFVEPKTDIQASDIVNGEILFVVQLTDLGRRVATWRAGR